MPPVNTAKQLIDSYVEKLEQTCAQGNATELTHRLTLQNMLERLLGNATVTNEPKRIACGAPDYVVTRGGAPIGYIEAKNIGVNLDSPSHQEQFGRYKKALANLMITDYMEFRLFQKGEQIDEVTVAERNNGHVRPIREHFNAFEKMLSTFSQHQNLPITNADDLAKQMAKKAQMLANCITSLLKNSKTGTLQGQLEAFKKYLIRDITPGAFADIYAQTIAYGMFSARLSGNSDLKDFSRKKAAELIPNNNLFLKNFFQHIIYMDLDPHMHWIVDDLSEIFRVTDVMALMKNYGKLTQRNDPFIYFYETFLGEYDSSLRKSRGVYYTPEPVVNFIVRAVDNILKNEFCLSKGLADREKTTIETKWPPSTEKNTARTKETHKVQILDPATGTGTFLADIVQHVHAHYFKEQEGAWPGYAKEHLIPRLNGFELLMPPHTMAHIKLAMVLKTTGCEINENRLRIFLTNTLEEHLEDVGSLPFSEWLADEAQEANKIKRETPVMVVIGNPPYSGSSANKGKWISRLLEDYKKEPGGGRLKEKNPKWINDDYVKFIRYGQHLIDETGEGVLAYVNNNGFLDNPTFRGMRWSLLQSFDKIYILDLHGNIKKKETAKDGSPDENVFDIQQGVSINLFIKTGKKKKDSLGQVFHENLYGVREKKYQFLRDHDINNIKYKELNPARPLCFFVPKNYKGKEQYDKGFKINELFPKNSTGIITARDALVIDIDRAKLLRRITDFADPSQSDEEIREKYEFKNKRNYPPGDSIHWTMRTAREKIKNLDHDKMIKNISYRPFDERYVYYHDYMIEGRRETTMRHFPEKENVGLIACKQVKSSNNYYHAFISKCLLESSLISNTTSEIGYVFPLYLYADNEQRSFDGQQKREPNLCPTIRDTIADGLGMSFTPEVDPAPETFSPRDLLDYVYAVLHAPAYRERYMEFLKTDFPRIPYPTDPALFNKLASFGSELRALHLMESPTLKNPITGYPRTGTNIVTRSKQKRCYELTNSDAAPNGRLGKVWINDTQYFKDVPEAAWNFRIGCYRPAQKWLTDRKDRKLTTDDIEHYQKIITALQETDRLMKEIDEIYAALDSELHVVEQQ